MRALWGICGIWAVVAVATIGAQVDLAGEWEITLDTHVGKSTWTANFEQEGESLTGDVDIGDREILPLKGSVDGNAVEFVFVLPDLDGDQPITLSGTVDGDSIEGNEGSFSWFGNGSWTAARR